MTGTEENERAGRKGTGRVQNGTGVQPATNPVHCSTPFDSPISPATQAGQGYLTRSPRGKARLKKGPDLTWRVAATLVKATPLAWGWLWELAAHREAGIFAAGDAGISGPYWETLWAWGKPVPTPGPRQQGLYQEQRLVIDQFGDQEAWAALVLACGPSLPASPTPRASAIERREPQQGLDQISHQSCSTHHPGLPGRFGGTSASSKALGMWLFLP